MTRRQWAFNLPFTLGLAATLLVAGALLYLWHGYAVRRNATALLHRADQLRAQGNSKVEARYLRTFLRINPLDDAVLARLALTLDAAASGDDEKAAAVQVLYQALAQPANSDRSDLQTRQLRLLWETRRFDDAGRRAKEVLARPHEPDDPLAREARVIQALAAVDAASALPQAADWSPIVGLLVDAIASEPSLKDHLELVHRLASIYRDPSVTIVVPDATEPDPDAQAGTDLDAPGTILPMQDRLQRAAAAYDHAVARFPDAPGVYLARFRFRSALGGDAPADSVKADLDRAVALAQDDSVDVWLGAGEYFLSIRPATRETVQQAETFFQRAVAADRKNRAGYLGLAETYKTLARIMNEPGRLDQAVAQVRTALETIDPRDFNLTMDLARLLHRAGKSQEARAVLEDTAVRILEEQTLQMPAEIRTLATADIERLRGEMFADAGDMPTAIDRLRRTAELERAVPSRLLARRDPDTSPLLTFALLGRCYLGVGNPVQAALAFEEALAQAPDLLEMRLEAARAWESAGQPGRAAVHYDALLQDPRSRERLPAVVARLLSRRILSGSVTDAAPSIQEMQRLIAAAEQAGTTDPMELVLLHMNLALARGDAEGAAAALADAEGAADVTSTRLRALAAAYEGLRRPADADRIWQTLEQRGLLWDAALLRAELLLQRGQPAAAEDHLVSSLDRLSPQDQRAARVELARIAADRGRTTAARDYLAPNLHTPKPDLDSVRQYAQLSAVLEQWEDVARAETLLANLEGRDTGTQWRFFRALRLATNASHADDPNLAEAEALRKDLERYRPGWSGALQVEALIAEKRGDVAAALAAYRALIEQESDLNQRSFATRRYLDLALARGPAVPGDAGVLPDSVAASPALSFQAVAREVAQGRTDEAVARAREAVQQRPRDPIARIWLAQTLLLAGHREQAEETLRQALQLGPENPSTWYALLAFYDDAHQADAMRQLAAQLETSGRLSEPERSLFLARAEGAVSDASAAGARYLALVERFPADLNVLQQAVAFFTVRDTRQAESLLRAALQRQPREIALRRLLARVLAARGDQVSLQESLTLLSGEAGALPREDADVRLYIEILARQGTVAARRQAIQIFGDLRRGLQSPPVRDVQLLAALYELDGQFPLALAELADLAGRPTPVPEHVAAFADFLLRHREAASHDYLAAANGAIQRLESVQPQEIRTLSLRIRWLAADGREAEIEPAIARFVEARLQQLPEPEARANALRLVGAACREVEREELAERYFRQAADVHASQKPALAQYLAHRGRGEDLVEAVAICEGLLAADPRNTAAITALCTALGKTDAALADARQTLLDEIQNSNRDDPAVLSALASLRFLQHRPEQAIELLRAVGALDPANNLAQNNLAYTLAITGALDESEAVIGRVLAAAGPVASFLDTYGLVLLLRGRGAEALGLFEDLARREPSAAILSHLAVARHRAGQVAEAKQAYEAALGAGLVAANLPQAEQDLLSELRP